MTKTKTIKDLEKKYNVHIERYTFWYDICGEEREGFVLYSADGCRWDNVLGYRSLRRALKEDKESLKRIAERRAM